MGAYLQGHIERRMLLFKLIGQTPPQARVVELPGHQADGVGPVGLFAAPHRAQGQQQGQTQGGYGLERCHGFIIARRPGAHKPTLDRPHARG